MPLFIPEMYACVNNKKERAQTVLNALRIGIPCIRQFPGLKELYHYPEFGLVGGNSSCSNEKKKKTFQRTFGRLFSPPTFHIPSKKTGGLENAVFSQFPVPGSNSVHERGRFQTYLPISSH
jgi:hypothetical protein